MINLENLEIDDSYLMTIKSKDLHRRGSDCVLYHFTEHKCKITGDNSKNEEDIKLTSLLAHY